MVRFRARSIKQAKRIAKKRDYYVSSVTATGKTGIYSAAKKFRK